jgi:uncharacterized protein (DUF39 family)
LFRKIGTEAPIGGRAVETELVTGNEIEVRVGTIGTETRAAAAIDTRVKLGPDIIIRFE